MKRPPSKKLHLKTLLDPVRHFLTERGDIDEDEPFYIMRGRDHCAGNTLMNLSRALRSCGVSFAECDNMLDSAKAMDDWVIKMGTKPGSVYYCCFENGEPIFKYVSETIDTVSHTPFIVCEPKLRMRWLEQDAAKEVAKFEGKSK